MDRTESPLPLAILPGDYSIHHLASHRDAPEQALAGVFSCLVAVNQTATLICPQQVHVKSQQSSPGWKVLKVDALLDHSLVGILAGIASTLADAAVPLFALSSWETDFILVRKTHLARAQRALEEAGHEFTR